MATTSLKLSDELKTRAQSAAEQQGLSAHAFMLKAIEQATARAELRQDFLATAYAARDDMQRTGVAYAAQDVHEYISAKVRGQQTVAPTPKARAWQK